MNLLDRLLQALPKAGASTPDGQTPMGRQGPTETLERLLATLQVAVHSMAICEVGEGGALALPSLPHPLIHYVLRGSGSLQVEGDDAIAFDPHTFVVVPKGKPHSIRVRGRSRETSVQTGGSIAMVDHMLRMSTGENHIAEIVTTCGTIEATYSGALGMFDLVDRPIALALEPEDPLRRAFEALLDELSSPRLGSRALSEALLKQCLVHLIRRTDPWTAGWLLGSVDPRLARIVLQLFEEPARGFTLEELARGAGMSRSSFAAQFQVTFGTTPIDLLKRIRLHHAARLLEQTDLPIAAIARGIGYESRTYFSRAFREEFGIDPRSFRAKNAAGRSR